MNTKSYILIDGSYYIFYRLFALINWWKLSHKDENIDNLHNNDEFIKKYKKIFQEKLKDIPKKLKIPYDNELVYIIGKDCPRDKIWRKEIYPNYKATRKDYSDSIIKPSYFFEMVYREKLFYFNSNNNESENNDIKTQIDKNDNFENEMKKKRNNTQRKKYNINFIDILSFETLEADDCLAIATNYIYENTNNESIYIITSDTDYMQLKKERIHLYNLSFKPVITSKNSLGTPEKDLLYKIIQGDKTDNIPPIFKKYGKKKIQLLCENISLFMKKIKQEDKQEQYELNKKLIDFQEIPYKLKDKIITNIINVGIII